MSASATASPFVGTSAADPDDSSVGFAVRQMSIATFRGFSCEEVRAGLPR